MWEYLVKYFNNIIIIFAFVYRYQNYVNFVLQRTHAQTLHLLLAVPWTDQVKVRKVRLNLYGYKILI